MTAKPDKVAPPDEWLAQTERDRAEALRRAAERGPSGVVSLLWEETPEGARERLEPGGRAVDPPAKPAEPPAKPTLDGIARLAESLGPDDRLRLVARIWSSLPAEHRSALVTLQLEDAQNPRDVNPFDGIGVYTPEPIWPIVRKFIVDHLIDRSRTSDLYSAPRRFDLATIFVVTAAYSLLFGGLTAMDAQPLTKITIGGLVTIVAASQALFLQTANPRSVSIVTGAVAYTLFSWILWAIHPRAFFVDSFFFVTVLNGFVLGGIMGYLAGVLVGGVFLVADVLRQRYGRPHEDQLHESQEVSDSIPIGDEAHGKSQPF